MKKIYFTIAVMVMSIFMVSAKERDVMVRFGVEGGFNITKWNGTVLPELSVEGGGEQTRTLDKASLQCGFSAGVLADLIIQTHWSIQPEILFAMEGSKLTVTTQYNENHERTEYEEDEWGNLVPKVDPEPEVVDPENPESQEVKKPKSETVEENVKAYYIRIPIIVYYNITNVGPGQLSPGVGFFFAGGIGGNAFKDDKKLLDEFDWGLNVKVAYEIQKGPSGLFVNVGFSQGFTESKSTGMNVSVGYKFKYAKFLKRKYNTGILEYNP